MSQIHDGWAAILSYSNLKKEKNRFSLRLHLSKHEYYIIYLVDFLTKVPLPNEMTPISSLAEVLREELVLSIQTIGMEPSHPGPLES